MANFKPDYPDSEGHIKLDARISPKLGRELAQDITDSVGATQLFILQPLPDILVVTQKQFASLQDYTEEMTNTTDRMYITPYNVMEVQIDRDVDTVAEVEGAIQDAENLKAQRKENPDDPAYSQDTESGK